MFNLASPKKSYMWLNCNTNYLGSFRCLDFYFYGKTSSTQDSGTHLPLWSGLDGGSGSTASYSHSLPSPSSNEGRTLRFSWHQGFKQWDNEDPGHIFLHQWKLNEELGGIHYSYSDEKKVSAAKVCWWVHICMLYSFCAI